MEQNENTASENTRKGGRKAGVPNSITARVREQIADIIEGEIDTLLVNLALMKPKEHADTVIGLMKYVMPTLKAVEVTDVTPNEEKGKKFVFEFVEKTE